MKHHVYELIDPRVNSPFYVGAGSGSTKTKRLRDHIGEAKAGQTEPKHLVINEILAEGLEPSIVVHDCIDATHTATMEKALIKQYGRRKDGGILTNKHPGGGGIRTAGRAANKNGRLPPKPVYQFDLEGSLMKCWPAITQAARGVGVSHTAIINACKQLNDIKTVGGYRWSYTDQRLPAMTKDPRTIKSVYEQYDMEWNYIATFETGIAVKKALGIDPSVLIKFLNGKIRHAGGFYWKRQAKNSC